MNLKWAQKQLIKKQLDGLSDQQQIKTRPKSELASTTSHSGNVLK